jgi:hypothetical protein
MIGSMDEFPLQDDVGIELDRFVQTLRIRLGNAAEIESKQLTPKIRLTSILPGVTKACSVSLVEMYKDELIVNVGGGRWELSRSMESLGFFKGVVESSISGDVIETFGLERVDTCVTFADGTSISTDTRTLGGLIPTPGWRHWGRKVKYERYVSDDSQSVE